jgi:hypothetical protein
MVTGSIEAVFSSMASLPFKNGGSSAQRADPCAIVMVLTSRRMVLPLGGADVVEGRAHVDPGVDPCACNDSPLLATLAGGLVRGERACSWVDKWLQRDTGHVFPRAKPFASVSHGSPAAQQSILGLVDLALSPLGLGNV